MNDTKEVYFVEIVCCPLCILLRFKGSLEFFNSNHTKLKLQTGYKVDDNAIEM